MFGPPSVSLMDLTGYIDQLRAFLPKAEKSGLSTGSEGVGVKGAGPMAYVDQALVKAWDRMSTKVSILALNCFVCKDFHYTTRYGNINLCSHMCFITPHTHTYTTHTTPTHATPHKNTHTHTRLQEVVKDALLKSSLPLAQTYLVHTRTSGNDKTVNF